MLNDIFGIVDISVGLAWLLIILIVAYIKKSQYGDQPHYKFYMPNVWYKLTFAFIFTLIYVFYYGGGDTTAYWDGAVNLNKLFWDNPIHYVEELFTTPEMGLQFERFNLRTGYPPSWIYREPESWFVSKLFSLFTFFTFNSYLATTFIISYIASLASWRLFELVISFNFIPTHIAAIFTLFIPTVNIWCNGISKDTLILISLLFVIYQFFGFFDQKRKVGLYGIAVLIVYSFILFHLRPFMIIAILPPLFMAFGTGIIRRNSDSVVLIATFRILIMIIGLFAIFLFFQTKDSLGSLNPEAYLEEAAIIQQDFAQNVHYTGKRYDLGITEVNSAEMIKAIPAAIIAAFYRPFIWESSSVFLVLSGVESVILLWLTFKFLFAGGGLFKNLNRIGKNEFLTFSIIFVLLFGFSVGFTSILFGVLVRFKAPILPFLAIVLYPKKPSKNLPQDDFGQ